MFYHWHNAGYASFDRAVERFLEAERADAQHQVASPGSGS